MVNSLWKVDRVLANQSLLLTAGTPLIRINGKSIQLLELHQKETDDRPVIEDLFLGGQSS